MEGVAEQELDLFDISVVLAAEFRASTLKVIRPEALDTDLPWQIARPPTRRPSRSCSLYGKP
jgi:hypothetical protein